MKALLGLFAFASVFALMPLGLAAVESQTGMQKDREIADRKHHRHHYRHDNNWRYRSGRWYYYNRPYYYDPYYYDPYYYEDGVYYDSRGGGRVIFRFGF